MIKPVLDVDLNVETQVVGISIEIPGEIREQQRRQHFRVSLSTYDIQAHAHEAYDAFPGCAPTQCVRFSGRLINISSGGLGLPVDGADLPMAFRSIRNFATAEQRRQIQNRR